MKNKNQYNPDTVSPPGATLYDFLDERNISVYKLAKDMGMSQSKIMRLLVGRELLTEEIATKLEEILGAPAEFWIAREKHYREFIQKEIAK